MQVHTLAPVAATATPSATPRPWCAPATPDRLEEPSTQAPSGAPIAATGACLPPVCTQLSPFEMRWLSAIDIWRKRNAAAHHEDPLPHPLVDALGVSPGLWRVLALELRTQRHQDAAARGAAAQCQTCVAMPCKMPLSTRVKAGGRAFAAEAKRLSNAYVELDAVTDVIDNLAKPMRWRHARAWVPVKPDPAPIDALACELRHAVRRLRQDIKVLQALREQVGAALVDLPRRDASNYPLWVIDVFARPPRRVAIANAIEQGCLRKVYQNYSTALTCILHAQLPALLQGLERSHTKVREVREVLLAF